MHSFSSSVCPTTALYDKSTSPWGFFWKDSVCFIQFLSSLSGKSSRACAPRDSLRAAADLAVCVLILNVRNPKLICKWKDNLRASQQISQFQSFYQIRIPDHASVLNTDFRESLINLCDLLDTLIQTLLCSEYADISLHDLLHG